MLLQHTVGVDMISCLSTFGSYQQIMQSEALEALYNIMLKEL